MYDEWKWREGRKQRFQSPEIIKKGMTKRVVVRTHSIVTDGREISINFRDEKGRETTMFYMMIFGKGVSHHLINKIYVDLWNEGTINRDWYKFSDDERTLIKTEFENRIKVLPDQWITDETIYGVNDTWEYRFEGTKIVNFKEVK